MSHQREAGYQQLVCNSDYEHCEQCYSKIFPGETFQVKPPPPNGPPSEGWSDRRCYPHCEQAAKDRAARTTPYPEVDLSPHTETFPSRYPTNWCFVCERGIRLGDWVTATKHDGPRGQYQRLWHNMHHVRCPPVVAPSRSARVPADDSSPNASNIAETRAEGNGNNPGVQKEENGGVEVNTEEGNGGSPGLKEEETAGGEVNTEEGNVCNAGVKEEENAGGEVKKEGGDDDGNLAVKREENSGVEVDKEEGHGSDPGVKEEGSYGPEVNEEEGNDDGHLAVKREEGSPPEAAEVERRARRRPATSGDSSFSEPPAKRSRFASQPSTERGTTTAAASNSSTPAINDNNDDNDDNDQESDPCPSPSQPRPHSAVAAASPTSTGAGVVPAASVEAPTRPARLKEGRSRAVPGEGQEQVSRNLAKAEGWVVDSSSSSKSAQVKVEPPVMG